MANLTETNRWEAGIYQLETSDPVMGGPNGIDNRAPRELANRTLWLKTELAKAVAQIGANKTEAALKTVQITAGAGLTGGGTLAANRTISLGQPADLTETSESVAVSNTHSHKLPRASSTARGIVRVANTLTGTATDDALSAAMGKKLADEKLGNSGDQTITDGTLTIGRANTWNKIIMPSGRGNWIFEANPAAAEAVADSIRFNFKFEEPGKKAKVLRFHQIGAAGETVAYQSWVAAKAAEAAAGKADTKKLTDEDLNSITTPGLYGQVLNVNATPERNYPTTKAGSLLSLPSAYNSDADLASHQIYIPFDTDEIWRRGKRNGGRWTDWTKITVSPAELEEAVRTAAGQAVLLTGAQTVRGVKTFSDGLKTPTPVATSNDTSVATTEFVRHAVDSSLPSGAVMYFAMQAAPLGWLKADGSAVSRTQYPALFAAIGTTFGAGNGKTTFNLPDLRGEFVRGWDGGRGIDPGRAFGSAQGDAIRNITGSIDTGINSGHQLFDEATATGALAISQRRWKTWTSDTQDGGNNPSAFDFDASRVVPTAAENRPRNIALLACIKI
ncbi:tail fiber protein [Neisseria elongata]|uniref:tail fiber protein n=1 Tax=Neisseria elongata TaxID=495 RepID=UPI001F46A3F1|nr:tail fiber protein [Neisseria elongata]DAO77169.1 MAG TPA: tail collar fiber protein [Caudoviricetes sp.]